MKKVLIVTLVAIAFVISFANLNMHSNASVWEPDVTVNTGV